MTDQEIYDKKQEDYRKLVIEITNHPDPFNHPRYDELSYDDRDNIVDKIYPDIGF